MTTTTRGAAAVGRQSSVAPLQDVRILDLSQFEAGPSCTQLLAWLGAEVIKVERPGIGEQGRMASQDHPDTDSVYFVFLNSNKKSITLDLKSSRGRDIFDDLVQVSDVIIENFSSKTVRRLGLEYSTIRQVNQQIIYSSIKGFPKDGQFGEYLAFDPVAQAVGGSTAITGESPDRPPVRPGPTLADTGAGLHMALAICAALYGRLQTGSGRSIEVTLQDSVVNFCRVAYVQQARTGRPTPRGMNDLLITAPSALYACKPGGPNDYCHIYAARGKSGNEHWDRLLQIIGREDLITNPKFASPELRHEHADEIDEIVEEWTRQHTKLEVMHELGKAGVPVGAVLDTLELSQDEELRSRGTFVALDHPTLGSLMLPGCPIFMSGLEVEVSSAPLLGNDNDSTYGSLLGMSADEIDDLRRNGII